MAVSDVSICNQAIYQLGGKTISALSDSTEAARKCNAVYSQVRDALLRAHPWNFAIKEAELSVLVETPEYSFDYYYELPSDCLRVVHSDLDKVDIAYEIHGQKLATNATSVCIKYIAQITDETTFDSVFVDLFAARLAAELSFAFTNSRTVEQQKWEIYKEKFSQATGADAQEGTPAELTADEWLDARDE